MNIIGNKKTGNNPWYTHYWEQNYWIIGMHIKKHLKPPPSDQWMAGLWPFVWTYIHEDWGGCMVDDFFVSVGLCKGESYKENTLTWTWVNLNEQNVWLIFGCCVFLQFRWLHSVFWKISKWIGQYNFQCFTLMTIFSGTKILTLGWHTMGNPDPYTKMPVRVEPVCFSMYHLKISITTWVFSVRTFRPWFHKISPGSYEVVVSHDHWGDMSQFRISFQVEEMKQIWNKLT